jgi:hypothetical protein
VNPYRVVYVPRQLRTPEATSHEEEIWGQTVAINVGSSTLLFEELLDMANPLGIPLSNGKLIDLVAGTIDNLEPLNEGETDVTLIEDLRTAWLLLHEAARFSIDLDVPLTLAG